MNSAEITARIIELRDSGLTWAQVGARVGLTRQAARDRWTRAKSGDVLALLKWLKVKVNG